MPHPQPPTLFPYTTLFRSSTPCSTSSRPRRRNGKPESHDAQRPRDRDDARLRCPAYAGLRCPYQARPGQVVAAGTRSEEHTSELQSHHDLVCRLLLEKKNL